MNYKKILVSTLAMGGMMLATALPTFADSISPISFESPYVTGNINGQQGWAKTGGYDVAVDTVSSFSNASGFGFGTQALRLSNSVTSGSFGDQTFTPGLTQPAGEAETNKHFEASFDIGSTQSTQQPGLFTSVSPDDGNGSRMSYVGFDDQSDGIHVIFYDVTDAGPIGTVADFNSYDVATIDRTSKHTIKFVMDFVPGAGNDAVKLYIDGVLKKTGTSWEDYYRYDPEQNGNGHVVFPTSKLLFREGGTAVPANAGNGYLVDNVSLSSGPTTPSTVQVHIFKYVNGVLATAANANNAVFPMMTSFNSPNLGTVTDAPFTLSSTGWGPTDTAYEASFVGSEPGADYAAHEVTGGPVVGATCSTGQPFALDGYSMGDSLSQAQAAGPGSAVPNFTNLQSDKYMIVWNKVCVGPPTLVSQCKNNGWQTFNNPPFTNQGACVSYVRAHSHSVLGNVKYTAYGLQRSAQFAADTADGGGAFQYSDATHAWYRVLITSLKVDGHNAWFAGRVWQASNPSWVGNWLFAKVNDSSPKRIWGSFTTKVAAESGVSSMGTPADGPFNTIGALVVH